MKSILVICNTPFQFVTIAHVLSLYYKGYDVDIIISDQFRDSHVVAENARKGQMFRNVYYIHNTAHKRGNKLHRLIDYYRRIIVNIFYALKIGNTHYDDVLFCNIQIFTKILISIIRKKNHCAKIHIVE